jgi:hypothetical protein
MWNELKGELNAILVVAPLFTPTDKATYHRQLTTYRKIFPNFKANDGMFSTFNSFYSNSRKTTPQHKLNF